MDDVVSWLLDGDVAVEYQTRRDLLDEPRPDLQARMATEGYAAALLAAQGADGHWGRGFYQPKWTSSHYTLLELKELGLSRGHPAARKAVRLVLAEGGPDGGLNPARSVAASDACVNGMALGYCSWFGGDAGAIASVVDFLLGQRMADGGFNCRANRGGARHSSLHTTTSVVEGIASYLACGYTHRADELAAARGTSVELLLRHQLYRSERTGKAIGEEFTRLHHPTRWHYDVLRGLETVLAAGRLDDDRATDALALLARRRRPDGRWVVSRHYPGATHAPGEPAGKPSRWVTLRALRVLREVDG